MGVEVVIYGLKFLTRCHSKLQFTRSALSMWFIFVKKNRAVRQTRYLTPLHLSTLISKMITDPISKLLWGLNELTQVFSTVPCQYSWVVTASNTLRSHQRKRILQSTLGPYCSDPQSCPLRNHVNSLVQVYHSPQVCWGKKKSWWLFSGTLHILTWESS